MFSAIKYHLARWPALWFLVGCLLVLGLVVACGSGPDTQKQREESTRIRAERFDAAQSKFGYPPTENFPLRGVLYDMTVVEDKVNHPWYIYAVALDGTPVAYWVSSTVPINSCDFLSSTEEFGGDSDGNVLFTAPSLDGIYYGGSGASGACDAYVFFEYSTGHMVWTQYKLMVSDGPFLTLNVPRLQPDNAPTNLGPEAPRQVQ